MTNETRESTSGRRFLKSILGLTLSTILSRILGLGKNLIQAHYFGTSGISDAFSFAFTLPNLMRRLAGEGALSSSFIPIYQEYKDDPLARRDFAGRFFGLIFLFLLGTALLVYIAAPAIVYLGDLSAADGDTLLLAVDLIRLMYPYALLVCLAALLQGVLNAHHSYLPSSLSPIVFNLVFIACGLAVAPFTPAGDLPYLFGAAVLAGGVAQLWVQYPFLAGKGLTFPILFDFWRDKKIRRALQLFGFGAFGAGIYQINVAVSRGIALGAGTGVVSYLTYSNLLIELVQGVLIVSFTTVLLPTLGDELLHDRTERARELFYLSIKLLLLVTIPAALGLIFLGPDIISVLYERGEFDAKSTAGTSRALFIHAFGLPMVAVFRTFSQAFYARKQIKTVVYVSAAAMLINIGLALWWASDYKEQGIAAAGLAATTISVLLLSTRIGSVLPGLQITKLLGGLLYFVPAGVIMALVLNQLIVYWPFEPTLIMKVSRLAVFILCGGLVYLALSLPLFRKEIREFIALRRAK